ncbi:chemerin-like receptor 1 [Labeo rohita]|uniref:chemerin-like receptor 1 n=1 Tax=Labeo rohita TaxID=84645 RepID=UPI0021E2AF06|nr:chemerin-like receptor 1 [Labeo rohita]XP_050965942.1 chemerin-like receptor 1 [Labeo rohita]XP_050965944.1 chemerin-like receptor 1 [Labeo rohita]XP_050965945.1 chemerin-like receptor 1 [Labeo rohita]
MSGEDNATDYDYIIRELKITQSRNVSENATTHYQQEMRMTYLITYSIVLILGVTLNFIVIVMSCLKNKNSPTVATWIMALAGTHLVSSASIVFQMLYAYNNFEWNYGSASCKLSSYIIYGSMFSTAAMLSFWSISFTFSKIKCTKNCKNCTIILISLSWTIGAVLACPSLFSREVRDSKCIDDYDLDKLKTTQDGITRLKAVVVMRFLIGVLVPALIMFLTCLTSANRTCKDCKKQAQIICAIKIVYFVFWCPQIVLTMIQATVNDSLSTNMLNYGLPAVTILATSHSFTNPIIYLLLGCSIKMNWMAHDPDQCRMAGDQGITLLPQTKKGHSSNPK